MGNDTPTALRALRVDEGKLRNHVTTKGWIVATAAFPSGQAEAVFLKPSCDFQGRY